MIFITGASGLLGSHLLCRLLRMQQDGSAPQEQLLALRRAGSSLQWLRRVLSLHFSEVDKLMQRVQWLEGDLRDEASYEAFITPQTKVYHVAAMVSFQRKDHSAMREVNVGGTAALVNVSLDKGVAGFCYASSIAAIGRGEGVSTEHDLRSSAQGSSAYSSSKYEAEMEVWRGIAEGLRAVIVNPAVILGPGQWNRGSSELFSTVAGGLKFFTRGVNGYVDVRDVARAMTLLMDEQRWGERFILSAANLSYEELFNKIARALQVPPPPYYAPPFLGQLAWRLLAVGSLFTGKEPIITRETAVSAAQKYYYSSEKIIRQTGFEFTPIDETIRFTAAQYAASAGETR